MDFLYPVGFITALSITFAVILAIANKKLWVWEDPRIDVVTDMLPGANCGACGVPGCRAFAERVVAQDLSPVKCTVGGEENAAKVAQFLGIDAGQADKQVARLLCAGGEGKAWQIASYTGYPTCRAAAAVTGGGKGCNYGCLGLADCERVCQFDAIKMSDDGLPIVDFDKCTACGDCVHICPKGLFELMPASRRLVVQCKSQLAGDEVSALCKVACTACGKCAMDAPKGLITMKNNLPDIDKDNLSLEKEEAVHRCPTGAIVWLEKQQFAEKRAQKKNAGIEV